MTAMKGASQIVIDASPEKIYDYVADFHRHVEWNYQPQKLEQLTTGAIRVGTKFKTQEQPPDSMPAMFKTLMTAVLGGIIGNQGETIAEVTALDAPHRVAWQAGAPSRSGYIMKADWEIRLEPTPHGTKVIQSFHFMPQVWFTRMMLNEAMKKQILSEQEKNLARLKEILEAV